MRYRERPRVLGPYAEGGDKHRLIVVVDGVRRAELCDSKAAALKRKKSLEQNLEPPKKRTVACLIEEYVRYMGRERGAKAESCAHFSSRMRRFFPNLDARIETLTPHRAEDIYRQHTERRSKITGKPISASTHRTDLVRARALFGWALRKRYIPTNVFADVRPVGKPHKGKPQLRFDEADRFLTAALKLVETGDALALAAVLCLLCGARTSEILKREVRDVDRGGAIIWVDRGKTESSRRQLEVPAPVQAQLWKLCEGRAATTWLFHSKKTGQPFRRASLWASVGRICAQAGVPRVCTHSLRGLWATAAFSTGGLASQVAAALGHTSFGMTQRHYIDPAALQRAASSRIASNLESAQSSAEKAAQLVSSLDRATLEEVVRLGAGVLGQVSKDEESLER